MFGRLGKAWKTLWGSDDNDDGVLVNSYLLGMDLGNANWLLGDSRRSTIDKIIQHGWGENSLVYRAIKYRADSATVPIPRIYTGSRLAPIPVDDDKHRLAKLIARPNYHQSWGEFYSLFKIFQILTGNAYIYLDRPNVRVAPRAMYVLPSSCVDIAFRKDKRFTDPDWLAGYWFTPEGEVPGGDKSIPIVRENIIHRKMPNPADPYMGMGYGMSPIIPGGKSIDIDNIITSFLRVFFERGGMPPLVMEVPGQIGKEEADEIKARFREDYQGYINWNNIGVLPRGAKLTRLGMNFNEMGFSELDDRDEIRICQAIGVHPSLVFAKVSTKFGTHANWTEARKAYWEDTALPDVRQDEQEFFETLRDPQDGAFMMFDISTVPALRRDIKGLVGAAFQMWQMGVPAQSALDEVGIQIELPYGGNVPYVPGGMIPIGGRGQGDNNTGQGDGEADTDDDEDSSSKGGRLGEHAHLHPDPVNVKEISDDLLELIDDVDDTVQGWVDDLMEGASSAFEADERAVLQIVADHAEKARSRKASVIWTDAEDSILEYLQNEGTENWREQFTPLFRGIISDVGSIWATELGVTFDVRNIFGEEWFADYTLEFAKPINDTTKETIYEVLALGQADGWSIDKMQNHLEVLFKQWQEGDLTPEDFAWFESRLPPYRTEMIARTETNRAAGAGSQVLYREWDVESRTWVATADDRTRPTHAAANGVSMPIEEPFEVGGYDMMFPGDTSLGAAVGEIVNCRCTIVPDILIEKAAAGTWQRKTSKRR